MNKPEYASALDIKLPILAGFYPDPSIVRVGETFYLANSSFEYAPGVPIHSSQNLIDWKFEGHSLPTRAQVNLDGMGNSMGVFAPTLRYHDGKFFMITTCVDDKWQLIVTAETASGPWSDVVRVNAMGIDPDLAWTEDGTCYMTFASLALNGIGQVVIDPSSGAMLSEPKLVWRGTGGKFPEGPHLYKIQSDSIVLEQPYLVHFFFFVVETLNYLQTFVKTFVHKVFLEKGFYFCCRIFLSFQDCLKFHTPRQFL